MYAMYPLTGSRMKSWPADVASTRSSDMPSARQDLHGPASPDPAIRRNSTKHWVFIPHTPTTEHPEGRIEKKSADWTDPVWAH